MGGNIEAEKTVQYPAGAWQISLAYTVQSVHIESVYSHHRTNCLSPLENLEHVSLIILNP